VVCQGSRSFRDTSAHKGAETEGWKQVGIQSGWLKRLLAPDRRRETRQRLPGLVAHYWDGAAPRARDVVDISSGGSYLQTEERWYPGTVFRVTLQSRASDETGANTDDALAGQTLVVLAEIVRSGPDGIGLRFIFSSDSDARGLRLYPDCMTDRKLLTRFLRRAEGSHSAVTFSID
jgi:hypothetical protein